MKFRVSLDEGLGKAVKVKNSTKPSIDLAVQDELRPINKKVDLLMRMGVLIGDEIAVFNPKSCELSFDGSLDKHELILSYIIDDGLMEKDVKAYMTSKSKFKADYKMVEVLKQPKGNTLNIVFNDKLFK